MDSETDPRYVLVGDDMDAEFCWDVLKGKAAAAAGLAYVGININMDDS